MHLFDVYDICLYLLYLQILQVITMPCPVVYLSSYAIYIYIEELETAPVEVFNVFFQKVMTCSKGRRSSNEL